MAESRVRRVRFTLQAAHGTGWEKRGRACAKLWRGSCERHLLKRGGAQLDGDVLELPVPLRAEVADDVGVLVRLPQQLNFSVREAEALGEDPLHRHATVVKTPPCGEWERSQQRVAMTDDSTETSGSDLLVHNCSLSAVTQNLSGVESNVSHSDNAGVLV